MNKPQKKTREYYDFFECMNYLQELYNFDYHNINGFNFWHWLIFTNFENVILPSSMDERENYPREVRAIFTMLDAHFGKDTEYYFGW